MAEGVVFERRLDRATGLALAALLLSSCLGPLMASPVSAAAGRVAEALAFTSPAVVSELVDLALWLAPLGVSVTLLAWASRRFSRATVLRDQVVIELLGLVRRGAVVIAVDDIVGRADSPAGVLLDAPATYDRLSRLLFPPLVPARDAAERARIHALLDAVLVGLDGDRRTASGGRGLTAGLLLVVACGLGIVVGVSLVLVDVGGGDPVAGGALLFVGALLGLVLLLPRRLRVHFGRTGLAVGAVRAPWSDVARLSGDAGALYLELASGRRRVARPGAEAVGRLLEVARARLPAERVGEGVPAWARVRRRRLRAAAAALALAGVWLGPVRTLTREGCLGTLEDHHGLRAWLVHRGRAPRLLLIVDPPAEPVSLRAGGWLSRAFGEPGGIEVDLRAGRVRAGGREHEVPRHATVVHVGPGEVRWSTRLLGEPFFVARPGTVIEGLPHGAVLPPPDEVVVVSEGLDVITGWGGTRDDPVVRDALDGRTTIRCLRSDRLLLRVDRGRLESMILIDPGLQKPCLLAGCWACHLARAHPGRLVRLTSEGPLDDDLPPLDDALAAFEAVRAGQPVEAATAGFAGRLWAAPLPVAGER
ncbi:MAG: hypothetical protein M9894_08525 [Planctomycetes bacterium]|nr:hypothetical protein [Planctomycetota bacterium]